MNKQDEASIALWLHYRREPELFAQLPEAWRHSIAEHYAHARQRQQLRQRRSVLPLSVLAGLAALSAAKARAATNYTTVLTGTNADTAYSSSTDANGNLVYRLAGGDSIRTNASGAESVNSIYLQSGTPKVVLQVGADGKGALTVSATRSTTTGAHGLAHAIDMGTGEYLTVNGNTTLTAQAAEPGRQVNGQWVDGSEARGLHLDHATAIFNGNLDVTTQNVDISQGLWINRGFLTVNGNTNIVTHGKSTNTTAIYNSGGGTGNVVFNGNLGIVSVGDWPNDTVQGIYNDNSNTRLTVNGDLNIAATSYGSTVIGLRNQGTVYVAGNATVTADGPRSALGVANMHPSARVHIGGDLKVTVNSQTGYTPYGAPTALGNAYGHTYGFMTLDGAVDGRVSGLSTSFAVNNDSVMTFTNATKTAFLRTSVNCTACDAYGVANNGGTLTLAGGLDVAVSNTGSGARYAIWNVPDGLWQAQSTLNVNQAGGQSVKVDGDVLTQNLVDAAGAHFTATTQVNFNDDASFLKGMVLGGSGTSGTNGTSTRSAGVPILSFANGARWLPTGTGTLASDFGAGSLSLGNGGAIDLAASWGAFAPGSVPAHSLRSLSVDSSTGGATVNLADGATFTLLSDIRNAQADKVSFGAGITTFNATGTQKLRIAYDPVLDDASWVSAAALQNGTTIAAAQPIVVVDASAAAGGKAAFQSVAGVAGQWSATYENALARFTYVPRVQLSADGKQLLLTGIDIAGTGGSTPGGSTPGGSTPGGSTPGGSTPGGSTPGGSTPGGSTGGGTGNSGTGSGTGSGTPPASGNPAGTPVPPTGAGAPPAITASTGVLVAADAALAMANLWQPDERAIARRSEALRTDGAATDATFWADADGGELRGDDNQGSTYRQNASSASAGVEWGVPFDGGHGAVGLLYTHAQSRATFQSGNADLRGNAVGAYGTWNTRDGWFADAAARVGRLRDSYVSRDSFGTASGRYDTHAASVSVRAGRRFQLGGGAYIEPQVQAAYGTLGPSSYTASDRVRFEVGHNRTFQSRAGVLAGQAFTWTGGVGGEAYVRLGVVHTVGSRPDFTASLDGGSLPVALPTRHDTAGEATAGVRLAFGQAWSAFAEAGRSSRTDVVAGGWRAAAGLRWRF
ncbi:autotransporter outer membrane beta-barrel domain-containing protein [Dyella marensis]|uniref:autotransporter outer membrane beta-barrel domain-containing protein n=1 Tax=Dyella marensis TaxID=500610 RepID=UPI0031DE7DCE